MNKLILFFLLISPLFSKFAFGQSPPVNCEYALGLPNKIYYSQGLGLHRNPDVQPQFVRELSIDNPQYIQENIRREYGEGNYGNSPYKNEYFKKYLQGLIEATTSVFDVEFRKGEVSRNLKEVLKREHYILTAAGYRGFMSNQPGNIPVAPGVFMYELNYIQPTVLRLPIRGYGSPEIQMAGPFPEKVWIRGLEEILRWRGIDPTDNSIPIVYNSFPRNESANFGIMLHVYPRFYPEVQLLYLERMAFVMGHIENCLLRPVPNTPVRNVLALLAEYYHVGVNSHLFERANNSLLMSQVNYFLHYLGLNGIRHQYWDYVALINHSPDFERLFINAIQEVNPNLDFNTI